MMISDDRQKHFAHLLIDGLWGEEFIDFDEDSEEVIIRETKRLIAEWVKEQGDIDATVRQKINSLQRELPEGSSEWKVMYNKYFADEMARRGHK
ncbi:MAG: DUF507 family protein [Bdellovibrionales bacterium]|nr:DUF507 family protein [Bdellovibrionales bacterium]